MQKRNLFIKIIIIILFILFINICIPIWVDPFNVFHTDNVRTNYSVEPNRHIIKMSYIMHHKNEFSSKFNTILFGSSRSGAIHTENIQDENCYNLSYSEALPRECLDDLKILIKNNIVPEKIYLGLDCSSYAQSKACHNKDCIRINYKYAIDNPLTFASLYCDLNMICKSLPHAIFEEHNSNYEHQPCDQIYNYGYIYSYFYNDWTESRDDIVITDIASTGDPNITYDDIDATLNDIKNIVDLCRDNDIKIIIFIQPVHAYLYRLAVNDFHYYYFLEKLTYISDYYNFAGCNTISTDKHNFIDKWHFSAYIGDIIISKLNDDSEHDDLYQEGFGWHVNTDNISDLISLLKKNDIKYNLNDIQ